VCVCVCVCLSCASLDLHATCKRHPHPCTHPHTCTQAKKDASGTSALQSQVDKLKADKADLQKQVCACVRAFVCLCGCVRACVCVGVILREQRCAHLRDVQLRPDHCVYVGVCVCACVCVCS
jgi:hypothetical protein